jgi:hypothetical protein
MDNIDTSEFFTLYPHLAAKIQNLWGTKDCRAQLMHLLNDSRGGSRAGFPIAIGKTIILLLKEHDTKFPRFDDTGEFIIPFTSVRSRPVIVKNQHDLGIIGTTAKLISIVLLTTIIYKVFKIF